MTNPHDEARTLMEKLAQIRPHALKSEQRKRREVNDQRNELIQRVGPKAIDGITFGARAKGNAK